MKAKKPMKINMMEVLRSVRKTVKTGKGGAQEPEKGKGSRYHRNREKSRWKKESY